MLIFKDSILNTVLIFLAALYFRFYEISFFELLMFLDSECLEIIAFIESFFDIL